MSESEATLSAALLSVLVDPVDHGPLWYFPERALLFNPRVRRAYAIRNQIPVLLDSEARQLSDEEAVGLERSYNQAIETGRG